MTILISDSSGQGEVRARWVNYAREAVLFSPYQKWVVTSKCSAGSEPGDRFWAPMTGFVRPGLRSHL